MEPDEDDWNEDEDHDCLEDRLQAAFDRADEIDLALMGEVDLGGEG